MQLTLFTTQKQAAGLRRKVVRRAANPGHQAWDLWSQPSDPEHEMALMFLDIRNFTPLTGQFRPAEVVHLVGKLLSTFQRLVRHHHGRIIETTGDGFYAAFGFDREIGVAVDDAVCAGAAIMKQLEVLNSSYEQVHGKRIELGIGIHAGKVAMGKIHLNGLEHLLVMGHAVNIAARLQATTKLLNNNFLISSAVFDLMTDRPSESASASVSLKGVSGDLVVRMIGQEYVK